MKPLFIAVLATLSLTVATTCLATVDVPNRIKAVGAISSLSFSNCATQNETNAIFLRLGHDEGDAKILDCSRKAEAKIDEGMRELLALHLKPKTVALLKLWRSTFVSAVHDLPEDSGGRNAVQSRLRSIIDRAVTEEKF